MNKITILLVDDHQLIMDAWTSLLNGDGRFAVTGTATDSENAFEFVRRFRPDVVLCDINLVPEDGMEVTKKIRLISPATKIIAVSMHDIPAFTKKMLEAGASGYVTKNSPVEELKKAIIEVYHGKKYICNEIKNKLASGMLEPDQLADNVKQLTRKELDVIQFIKKGLSSKEIAMRLDIALKTVEVHRYNILRKLGLRNTAALVNFMHTKGL